MSLNIKLKTFNVDGLNFEVIEDTTLIPNVQYDGTDNGAIRITNNRSVPLNTGYFTGNIQNTLRCFIPITEILNPGDNVIMWVSLYGYISNPEDNFNIPLKFIEVLPT